MSQLTLAALIGITRLAKEGLQTVHRWCLALGCSSSYRELPAFDKGTQKPRLPGQKKPEHLDLHQARLAGASVPRRRFPRGAG